MIKSTMRSATIVPKALSNGMPSYFLRTSALENSPDLGIVRLTKYAIQTAIKLLENRESYPKWLIANFHLYARERNPREDIIRDRPT